MANATWWVRFTDKSNPGRGEQLLSLASPDYCDARKAVRTARDTAKKRLLKRGVRPCIVSVRCVG